MTIVSITDEHYQRAVRAGRVGDNSTVRFAVFKDLVGQDKVWNQLGKAMQMAELAADLYAERTSGDTTLHDALAVVRPLLTRQIELSPDHLPALCQEAETLNAIPQDLHGSAVGLAIMVVGWAVVTASLLCKESPQFYFGLDRTDAYYVPMEETARKEQEAYPLSRELVDRMVAREPARAPLPPPAGLRLVTP